MTELRATQYTVTTTAFTIVATPSCACAGTISRLFNRSWFRLITCLAFPSVPSVVPVFISINGVSYPVLDEIGNTLKSDQIRCRRAYKLVFGTGSSHFMVKQCLPVSQSTATYVSATPPTSEPEAELASLYPMEFREV